MRKFTPIQYLMIDIANSFGLDKETWDVRLDWFQDNKEDLCKDPIAWASKAEEPATFLAGMYAYEKYLAGQKTGYLCGLDATASGIQLLSLLSGCVTSASQCNLVNTGNREDAYTNIQTQMNAFLGTTCKYSRKVIKAAGMTHFYGSKLEPIKAFGEDTPELRAFYQAINSALPGANELNYALLGLWQPDALIHEWVLPDGFEAKIKVIVSIETPVKFMGMDYTVTKQVNQPKESSLSIGANIIHSLDGMIVREMGRRCMFRSSYLADIYLLALENAKGKKSTQRDKDLELLRLLELVDSTGFMSLAITEYIDEDNYGHLTPTHRAKLVNLIESLPSKPFHLLAIHDCFRFHANYGNDVREQYINIMAELAESDVLASIATQIQGKDVKVNKKGDVAPYIRQSDYMLS